MSRGSRGTGAPQGAAPTPGGGSAPGRASSSGDLALPSRLHSLTGLRFWAALLVVMYHLSAQTGQVPVLSHLTAFGRTGVTFFFVLSGFVLAWSYLDRPVALRVFLWRRWRAAMWGVCAVVLVGLWWVFGAGGWARFWIDYFPPSRLVVAFYAAMVPCERAVGEGAAVGPYSGSQWWSVVAFALLIVAAAQADIDGRRTLVRGAWSVRLGAWSYAWYLIHEPLIRVWNELVLELSTVTVSSGRPLPARGRGGGPATHAPRGPCADLLEHRCFSRMFQ